MLQFVTKTKSRVELLKEKSVTFLNRLKAGTRIHEDATK